MSLCCLEAHMQVLQSKVGNGNFAMFVNLPLTLILFVLKQSRNMVVVLGQASHEKYFFLCSHNYR